MKKTICGGADESASGHASGAGGGFCDRRTHGGGGSGSDDRQDAGE